MQTVVRPDILAAALSKLPPNIWRKSGEGTQAAVSRLQRALVVERQTTSYQISIRLTSPNAKNSASIVNAVTNAYLEGSRRDEIAQASGQAQLLAAERGSLVEQIGRDRTEQASLGAALGVADPAAAGVNPFDLQLANLRVQLATARQARDVAAAQLSSVSAGPDNPGLAAAADESLGSDLGLSSMKSAVNTRRVALEGHMAGLTPNNPAYKQDQEEIVGLNRKLATLTAEERSSAESRIQGKLRAGLQQAADVESRLAAEFAQATTQATGAGPKLQRAAELAADIQRLTAQFATVDESLRSLRLQTDGPGLEHIALAAQVPVAPESNKRPVLCLFALPVGLFFGILAAIVARVVDRRIYLSADLQAVLNFPPLAVLPARGEASLQSVQENVFRLAAGIENAYRADGARSFVFTAVSASSSLESTVRSVAQQLRRLQLRVHLLSATDLLIPTRGHLQHLATAALGLSEWENAPSEGIASTRLRSLKRDYDIILIKAAPLLYSAATEYAARSADATILVAQSGVTLCTEVTEAAGLLSRLQVPGIAAVLDAVHPQDAGVAFQEREISERRRQPSMSVKQVQNSSRLA